MSKGMLPGTDPPPSTALILHRTLGMTSIEEHFGRRVIDMARAAHKQTGRRTRGTRAAAELLEGTLGRAEGVQQVRRRLRVPGMHKKSTKNKQQKFPNQDGPISCSSKQPAPFRQSNK